MDVADAPSSRSGRRPTIVDVAKAAEVSPAAVSKVLRDAYGVSAAMKERVTAAVDALGYRPLLAARGMRTATRTLGISAIDPDNPFPPMLLVGIARESERQGYAPFVALTVSFGEGQLEAIRSMVDRAMDGLILVTPSITTESLEALAEQVPLVLLGSHGTGAGYDSVASDDALGARLVVDHLVGLGHRRIVFHSQTIQGSGLPDEHRRAGYLAAMESHGLEPDVVLGSWSPSGGARLAADLLARPERPTAVHAGCDAAALGMLDHLRRRGVDVPGELAVMGCDDVPAAAMATVELSSVDQHAEQMGELATRLLIERIEGRSESHHLLVPPRLRLRATA